MCGVWLCGVRCVVVLAIVPMWGVCGCVCGYVYSCVCGNIFIQYVNIVIGAEEKV